MAPDKRPPIKARLARTASGEGRMQVSVGHAMYGHVKIRIHPGKPGSGFVFENRLIERTIPEEFIQPIADGLKYSSGHLGHYRVDDVRVELVDGSYHDIDSSGAAFFLAGAKAFLDAARNAGLEVDGAGDDRLSGVTSPRHPSPAPRASSAAVPEPEDARDNFSDERD
jgi:hypothetical protein